MTEDEFRAETVERLSNLEKVVMAIQAQMTPKWLRVTTWAGILAAALKEFLS